MVCFQDTLRRVCAEGTVEAFDEGYRTLHERDPQLSLFLAVLTPWLVTPGSEAWARTHAPSNRARSEGAIPVRQGGAPVTNLCISAFSVGTTSFTCRVEWPLEWEFEEDWLEVWFNEGLEPDGWEWLGEVQIVPGDGYKSIEMPYDGPPWYAKTNVPPKGFFRVRPADKAEWFGSDGGRVEDGDPPDIPPPVAPQAMHARLVGRSDATAVALSETVSLMPGQHYLMHVITYDYDLGAGWQNGRPTRDLQFSWSIAIPGMEPLTGGTDSYALLSSPTGDFPGVNQVPDFWLVTVPTNAVRSGMVDSQISLTIVNTSSSSASGYYTSDSTGLSELDFHIGPLILQGLIPTNTIPPRQGSTDFGIGGYVLTNIAENGVAFISGIPSPPTLTASFLRTFYGGDYGKLTCGWRLEVETERPGYRNTPDGSRKLDNRMYPTNGTFHTSPFGYSPTCFITSTLMSNELVGGKCTLHYKVAHVDGTLLKTDKFIFYIKGMNPPDATVTNFIANNFALRYRSYAGAILRHESKVTVTNGNDAGTYTFCQFNPGGATKWLPNKTDDTRDKKGNPVKQYGWGIGQIDKGALTNGATRWVTTAEVWNWRTNVLNSAAIFEEKKVNYEAMLGKIRHSYPTKWVEPPATNIVNGIHMSAEQFAVTVLYNGGGGVQQTRVKTNDNPEAWGYISCPLAFDSTKSPANRWTFSDNSKKYADKISKELSSNPPPARE